MPMGDAVAMLKVTPAARWTPHPLPTRPDHACRKAFRVASPGPTVRDGGRSAMNGKTGKSGDQIDWAAFLRTPAFSYLVLTILSILVGLAYMLLRSM
jgi:hypothetical protein